MSGAAKTAIEANPHKAAVTAAHEWQSIVALKGAVTCIAMPDRRVWRHDAELSGSASPDPAMGWQASSLGWPRAAPRWSRRLHGGVVLHARVPGTRLASRFGPLGYMAHEIAAEIPALMHELRPKKSSIA